MDRPNYNFGVAYGVLDNAHDRRNKTCGNSAMRPGMEFDGNPGWTEQAKARARWWPSLNVPRYSMPHRKGAMVRLDTGQGAS